MYNRVSLTLSNTDNMRSHFLLNDVVELRSAGTASDGKEPSVSGLAYSKHCHIGKTRRGDPNILTYKYISHNQRARARRVVVQMLKCLAGAVYFRG